MPKRISVVVPILLLATNSACGEKAAGAKEAPSAAASELAPAAVPADDHDADVQELSEYELSMEDLGKLRQATRNLNQLMRTDPELKARLENDDDDTADGSGQSFDEVEARFDEIPEAREAIERADLTVRDYVLVLVSTAQATMAEAMIDQGLRGDSVLQNLKVNPRNLEFVRRNKAAVEQILEEVTAKEEKEEQ